MTQPPADPTRDHQEREDQPWTINIPGHAKRSDSPEYVHSRQTMNNMASQVSTLIYGQPPYEDHHGGGLWLKDAQGWFLVRNPVGMEWSSQFCVSPDVRVLTVDLQWVPIGEVRVGDHLAGFDEVTPFSGRRRWRRSVVERNEIISRPCYDLTFEDGTQVRASADHLWLACGPGGGVASWYRTDALVSRPGGTRAVLKSVEPWEEDTSWEAGYLAAAFDGEGHLLHSVKGGGSGHGGGQNLALVFSQRDNELYTEVVRCLKHLGYTFREDHRPDIRQVVISRRNEVLRFLGSIRPRRLLAKFQFEWLGQFEALSRVKITETVFVGDQPVAVVSTSSGTYIAEGLASHNCADPAKVDLIRQNAKRLYAAFPGAAQELGIQQLLDTPITDAAGVAQWTDSICNASVPLPTPAHTGVLPTGGGVHHYPSPITEIAFFKHESFQLWVTDAQGNPAAVAPVGPPGSGDGRIHVLYATPGSDLAGQVGQAEAHSQALILDPSHPLAQQAFAQQTT